MTQDASHMTRRLDAARVLIVADPAVAFVFDSIPVDSTWSTLK